MSNIEKTSGQVAIAAAITLAAGLALQIASIYATNVSGSNIMATLGKAGTFVGGAGLGIALPLYVLKRGEKDPSIYKKLIVASLVGVVAGAVLMGVNTGHQASQILGQSLITLSGGLVVTMLFYYLIYGRAESSKKAKPVAQTSTPRSTFTGISHTLGQGAARTEEEQAEHRKQLEIQAFDAQSHLLKRGTLFGDARRSFELQQHVAAAPTAILADKKGVTAFNQQKAYTLARDAQGRILCLTSTKEGTEQPVNSAAVTAEIWNGADWTDLGRWHHKDERIIPFIEFVRNGVLEETAAPQVAAPARQPQRRDQNTQEL